MLQKRLRSGMGTDKQTNRSTRHQTAPSVRQTRSTSLRSAGFARSASVASQVTSRDRPGAPAPAALVKSGPGTGGKT